MTQQVTQDPQEPRVVGVSLPVWAWAGVVGLAYIMVMSVFELSTSVILILLAGVAAIVAVAVGLAPRYGATRTRTAVLLVPLCAFALFAAAYGFAMLQDPPRIVLESGNQARLLDPLLLSFGFLTMPVLGLDVDGWARGVVLLQLLSFVLYAVVAAVVTARASSRRARASSRRARAISRRLDQLTEEIKRYGDSG